MKGGRVNGNKVSNYRGICDKSKNARKPICWDGGTKQELKFSTFLSDLLEICDYNARGVHLSLKTKNHMQHI
jgi:hypothetical protein